MAHVLIIDDEEDIRTVARLALESVGGMHVSDCSGSAAALEFLAREKPDLILLDYMMPGTDGPATLKLIREVPGCESMPVVFLTARAQAHELAEYKELGVAGTVTKPFDPMQLAEQLKLYLA